MFYPATLWALIPLVVIVGGFITRWMRINAETARAQQGDQLFAELNRTVQRLEQRVANLERAVMTAETERKFSL